jgi:porin
MSPWLRAWLLGMTAALAPGVVHADDVPPPQHPFALTATLNTDLMADIDGGLRRGALPITDLEMAGSWKNPSGWRGYLDILVDSSGRFSQRYSGDLQSVSSIDAVPATHLYEMWIRKTTADGRHVTTVGIINLNRLFDVQPVGGLFVNASSGIGPDYSQTAPSIYPITSLGAVSEWQPVKGRFWRIGLFGGVSGDPGHPRAFTHFGFSGKDGATMIVEREQTLRAGTFKLGAWYYSAPVKSFDGARTATRLGSYAQYAKTVWRGGDRKLDAWLRLGVANSNALKVSNYEGGGFALTGLLPGRPKDQAGVALYRAGFGDPYRSANPGAAPAETTIEATYQYAIKDDFTMQPDLQYVMEPSGDRRIGHALVVGLRLKRKLADLPLP